MWDFLIEIERKIRNEYWNFLITGYCKVEFLCYNGEPNWLGWIPLGFLILMFIVLVVIVVIGGLLAFIGAIFEVIEVAILSIQNTFKKVKSKK